MKKYSIIVLAILINILAGAELIFAQTLPDLGLLNDRARTLAKPVDPFDVAYGNLSGTVKVNVTVDEKGSVIKAEAVSGDERLRLASVAAAKASKFTPYLVKGKPIKVKGFLNFQFGSSNNSDLQDFINKISADGKKMEEAQRLYNKGDYNEAIKILTDLINAGFLNTSEREFRARCYFKLKDYKNALQDINDSIAIRGESTPALVFNFQGDIYAQLTDYPKAAESYTKVIELDPKNTEAFGNRGYAHAKLSKKTESTADFKKVTEIDPSDKYAKYNLDALANDRKVLSREEYKALKQIYYV